MEATPAADRLQLVFRGECVPGHDPQAVREAVVRALKLDAARSERLFSGERVVLRRAVDIDTAHRYIARFALLGAVVHAEPALAVPVSTKVPADPPRSPAPEHPKAAVAGPVWRVLRWAGLGVAVLVGAVLLGLLLGPGLGSLWPEVPAADATAGRDTAAEGRVAPPPVWTVAEETAAPAIEGDEGDAEEGAMPVDMTPDAVRDYHDRYLPARGHKAFAVSPARVHAWHAGAATEDAAREAALNRCMGALRPGDEGCRIVDVDGELLE